MAAQANALAYLALLLIVPASIVAFAALPTLRAVLAILLGTTLFLPEVVNFDAPGVPELDKHAIAALCILVGLFVTAKGRQRLREARAGRGIDLVAVALLFQITGTVLTNRDTQVFGSTVLRGHVPSDILSLEIGVILNSVAQFVIGRVLVRSTEDAKDLLKAFVIAGLFYLPLCLVELRLSPQFHNWIYGFQQHDFAQVRRAGGWRPMVFMRHGLALSLFMFAAAVAAWACFKARVRVIGISALPIALVLTLLLPLLNSLGALVYALVAIPVVLVLGARSQMWFAVMLSAMFIAYPAVRPTPLFPREEIVNFAAQIRQDRAASLDYRFGNEEVLIEHALERPWFGWGSYGRFNVYSESGRQQTVTDGAWIIMLGSAGIFGLIIRFCMLQLPIFSALRRFQKVSPDQRKLLAATALLAAFYTFDLLPNGLFNPLPTFLSGCVMGLSQGMSLAPNRGLTPELIRRWLLLLERLPRRATTNVR